MPTAQLGQVIRQLRRTTGALALADRTDRQLLVQFVTDHDEAAFALLVQRHGPMVLGVSLRVLRHRQDAEDAFQATFLVLARQAATRSWHDSIGPWLHEVAQRTALKARGLQVRRGTLEKQVAAMPEPEALSGAAAREWSTVLDEELQRLPEKFRGVLVLCHLEGLCRDEAARQLGLTIAAVKDRLERGRALLRKRLTRRGITLSAALLASGLTAAHATAALPPNVINRLLQAACASLHGQLSGVVVTPAVLTLTEGVLETMGTKKLHTLGTLLLVLVGLGSGAGLLTHAGAEPPAQVPSALTPGGAPAHTAPAAREADDDKKRDNTETELEGEIRSVDTTKNQLTVKLDENDFDTTYDLAKDATIRLANKDVKLSDLKPNMKVTLRMSSKDAQLVALLQANWPPLRTAVKAVDPAKGTLTIELEQNEVSFEKVFTIEKGAAINIDGLTAGLGDLSSGTEVELQLSADKQSLVAIKADRGKDELPATLQEIDAAKSQVVIRLDDEDAKLPLLAFDVAKEAKVRLTGKDATLADLKANMPVLLKLGADRKTVVGIRADVAKPKPVDD